MNGGIPGPITPPVGMTNLVIRAQIPTFPLNEIIRGVAPFLAAHLALVVLLAAVPEVATWLLLLLTP